MAARLEAAATAVFTLWVVWPLVGPGGFTWSFDTVAYSGPNLAVTLDAARHGRLATWNPFAFGGVSHLGNIQAAPLYVPKWPFAWMDVQRAWLWLVALHVVWLAAGMFWLVRRRLALCPPAALVATVAVVGSGMVMVRVLFFEQILVLAWAPWLLGALDGVLAERATHRGRRVGALAIVVAAMTVAGHPQMLYVIVPLAAAWTVARAVDRHGSRWWRSLGPVLAAGALGAMMAAPQLLPAAASASRSANTGGRALATISNPGYSVQLSRLVGTWLGDPLSAAPTEAANGYENLTFVGVVVTVLALVAVVALAGPARRQAGWRWTTGTLTVVVAAALLLAVGPRLVFYRAAFRLVPGFDQARVPGRWVTPAVIAAGILAAYGVERIRRAELGRAMACAVAGLTAAAAVVIAVGPMQRPGAATLLVWAVLAAVVCVTALVPARWSMAALAFVAVAGAGELALAQRASMARTARTPELMTASTPPAVAWLQARPGKVLAVADDPVFDAPSLTATLRPNSSALFGVASVDGYDGGIQVTKAWATAMRALSAGPFDPESPVRGQLAFPLDPEALARLGVRWVLLDTVHRRADQTVPAWGDPVFVDRGVAIYENPAGLGPAWLQAGDGDAAHARTATGTDTATAVVLDDLVSDRPAPERLTLSFRAPQAGRVVVTEQWDPGWQARLDGTPVAVVPSGPLYLGVDVPPGEHVLQLRYRAAHLRLGLLLWALAVAVIVALGVERPGFLRRS